MVLVAACMFGCVLCLNPHMKVGPFLASDTTSSFTRIKDLLNSCTVEIVNLNSFFQSFKKSTVDPNLDSKLEGLINEGKAKRLQLERIKLDVQCKEYNKQIAN